MSEVRASRLVIHDDQDRPRAILECGQSPDPPGDGGVSLKLFAATGDPMMTAELDKEGQPRFTVGHPDRGTVIFMMRSEIQLWTNGNMVAVISSADGGSLELFTPKGERLARVPEPTT